MKNKPTSNHSYTLNNTTVLCVESRTEAKSWNKGLSNTTLWWYWGMKIMLNLSSIVVLKVNTTMRNKLNFQTLSKIISLFWPKHHQKWTFMCLFRVQQTWFTKLSLLGEYKYTSINYSKICLTIIWKGHYLISKREFKRIAIWGIEITFAPDLLWNISIHTLLYLIS